MNTANLQYDNASQRLKASSHIFNIGSREVKKRIFENIDSKFSSLHQEGKIHIHDLETYTYTYNCLQLNVLQGFPYEQFSDYSSFRKITGIFNYYQNIITKLGHEQSGGIGFPNFDEELAVLFDKLNLENSTSNQQILKDSICNFVDWLNDNNERNCQYSFYVTLNLGLSTKEVGRFTTRFLIEYFMNSGLSIIKPNIVFKLKQGVNYKKDDPNYDLFCLSVQSTCKKMIPTYLLFDSKVNEMLDPMRIGIMGCRTKVAADIFGEPNTIGRANIAYTSINLPRIALEIEYNNSRLNIDEKFRLLNDKWKEIAFIVKDILLDRYNKLLKLNVEDFPNNYRFNLWIKDFKTVESLEEIFKHGTLSIGFIGLSETIEILTGNRYYSNNEIFAYALSFVKYMRETIDEFIKLHKLNFTLLASSGEFISGRFPEIDGKYYDHPVLKKGFYTKHPYFQGFESCA